MGRNGYDGNGAGLEVSVNCSGDNAAFSTFEVPDWGSRTSVPSTISWMGFSTTRVAGHIVGHEFTHGVTGTSAMLIYTGESGALNESYSDVLGNLAFPDASGGWLAGEESKAGAIRDLAFPSTSSDPNVGWQPDHFRGPGGTRWRVQVLRVSPDYHQDRPAHEPNGLG
jgi:bacillolysin/thermolysin